jgi:hypothetical protein
VDTNEVNKKFEDIIKTSKPKAAKRKPKREPAKFPELRYLWGVALLGSFVLTVVVSLITTILESV